MSEPRASLLLADNRRRYAPGEELTIEYRVAGLAPEVLEAVNAWAKAWSAKNVDAYLAAYARDFQPPKGESREDWAKGRRQRISAPKSIAVTVESPRVSITGDQASVTFRQGYRSEVIKSSSTKTLVLVRSEGRWLIRQEKVHAEAEHP